MSETIALIGFGEAGSLVAVGLASRGDVTWRSCDIGFEDAIFYSVADSRPGLDWRQLATYDLGRIAVGHHLDGNYPWPDGEPRSYPEVFAVLNQRPAINGAKPI